ncbi:hypothetical protein M3231_09040 [Neobacillus mesonae]|nr:hypothetical protein [Neobacillus mesonae]
MERVKLSEIVTKWFPEILPTLKQNELNALIVLRDGFGLLEPEDAMEIIQYSICEHQDELYLQ